MARKCIFLSSSRGATAVELAFVLPIFMLLFLGVIEFGGYNLARVMLESAVADAGRVSAVGGADAGNDRLTTVINRIRNRPYILLRPEDIAFTANKLSDGGAFQPDLCLNNGPNKPPTTGATCPNNPSGVRVFIEMNGVPDYQGGSGGSVGSSGDIVELRVTYGWNLIFPIFNQFFGQDGVLPITISTVVKNEPF